MINVEIFLVGYGLDEIALKMHWQPKLKRRVNIIHAPR